MNTKEPDQHEDEVVIPMAVKPYLNKELNFDLYLQLLTEKVDPQRVRIDLKTFKTIDFSQHGVPLLILEIMAFLTKESRESIFEKKINQLLPGLLESIEAKEREDGFI